MSRKDPDTKLSKAVKKYGKENFELFILDVFESYEEAFQKEAELIKTLGTLKKGYNSISGGQLGRITPLSYLNGKKFGSLTVIEDSGFRNSSQVVLWVCECDCGNIVTKNGQSLRKSKCSKFLSCGCQKLTRDWAKYKTHGMTKTKEYRSWYTMKKRCYNKNSVDYIYYGKLGVTVDANWLGSFENFYSDMGKCPRKDYSLCRKDKAGNYTKDNCYWGNRKDVVSDSKRNHNLTYLGETKSMSAWSEDRRVSDLGISYTLIRARKNMLHWDDEKTLSSKPTNRKGLK